MKAYITVGISASGKTTWAKRKAELDGCQIICRDDIRVEIVEGKYGPGSFSWAKWKWFDEKKVTKIQRERIELAASKKEHIIIADTNLNRDRRNQLIQYLESLGYETETVTFHISFEEAIRRDNERPNGVGYSTIARQHEQMYASEYLPNTQKQSVIICDIDGTLALRGDRNPYDETKVLEDTPNPLVVDCVRGLAMLGHKILFFSGRKDSCYLDTYTWLENTFGMEFMQNHVATHGLLMRKADDVRSDVIVKREMFWFICDDYNVVGVIDDRPKVCRMWREIGLQVLQVGNPYIEF